MKLEVNSYGESYALKHALLVYESPGNQASYATKHPVQTIDGKPMIRPGAPLTEGDYKALIEGLKPKDRPTIEWNDPTILAKGMGRLIWWTSPRKRSMFFKSSSHAAKKVDGKNICPNPGLVFMAGPRTLHIFAFKGEAAPVRTTKLYQAPFFNVWSDGKVCSGNATLPEEDQRNDRDAWERFFFGSHFTHPNFSQKDRLTLGVEPCAFWQKQLNRPTKAFPESVLVDINLTVNDLLALDFYERPHVRVQGEF